MLAGPGVGTRVGGSTCVIWYPFTDLLRRHGRTSLSAKTVARYVAVPDKPKETIPEPESQRGAYRYPPPLAMAWIDTTHFEEAYLATDITADHLDTRADVTGFVYEHVLAPSGASNSIRSSTSSSFWRNKRIQGP